MLTPNEYRCPVCGSAYEIVNLPEGVTVDDGVTCWACEQVVTLVAVAREDTPVEVVRGFADLEELPDPDPEFRAVVTVYRRQPGKAGVAVDEDGERWLMAGTPWAGAASTPKAVEVLAPTITEAWQRVVDMARVADDEPDAG